MYAANRLALISLAVLLGGCVAPAGVTVRQNGGDSVALAEGSELLPSFGPSAVIAPLDHLRVRILPLPGREAGRFAPHDRLDYDLTLKGSTYRILRGDVLDVAVGADPKQHATVTVLPDGKISLDNGAEVTAAGKTPLEVAAEVDAAYAPQMPRPRAAVAITRTNFARAEMAGTLEVQPDGSVSVPRVGRLQVGGLTEAQVADALADAAGRYYGDALSARVSRLGPAAGAEGGLVGFDQSLTVSADGLIALPELGFVAAQGQTVISLQERLQSAVNSRYPNPTAVVVGLEPSDVRMVYVDGEVNRPGAYPLTPSLTMLRAITIAGGVSDMGDLRRVVLIHRTPQSEVYVYSSNLKLFMEKGVRANDLLLSPQDIVVVLKTRIARADLWVDQYITRMLPFGRDVTYSYTQGVTRLNNPVNP